jgi:carbamate kinase
MALDSGGSPEELVRAANDIAGRIVGLIQAGWRVLIVHGNGPQVGVELLRNEEASNKVPPFGLDLCVGSTQGSIATLLETALRNALREDNMSHVRVASLVSLVEVASDDPALDLPSKPIGPFYSRYRAQQILKELQGKGWDLVEDSGRGWRTVVPSPRPQRVVSAEAVECLISNGFIVIAGGGGGVPVIKAESSGHLTGTEAVIDKDRTAALLAEELRADLLIFLTAVPWVELNFGTPFARRIETMSTQEARKYLQEGQFPAGSMGPKIEAACDFADRGRMALITSAETLTGALHGRAGTRISNRAGASRSLTGQLPLKLE